MNDFAKALKGYISKRGWTIKHVSRKTKVPETTLYAWTCGSRIPPEYIQDLLFYRMDGLK